MEQIEIQMEDEDRYSRLRLIPWWNQQKLKDAVVMVVGAGAIGNEILKNLALLGVGTILIVDMDRIENSNLSRAVLYRESDEGTLKAEAAARQVMMINPDVKAIAINGSIITDVGTGFFRHVDLVLGGLDNREARLAINQKCWKTNTPWIDGAIEVFQGFARVFVPPESACYECTMSETDYHLLNYRKSCSLLTRKDMLEGKVPTTPTTASVIAGIQVQEAVKIIHGDEALQPLKGSGIVFNGLTHDTFQVTYTRKKDCLSHETWDQVTELNWGVGSTTLSEITALIREKLSPKAVLETDLEILLESVCHCGCRQSFFRPLITVSEDETICPQCASEQELVMTHCFTGEEDFAHRTLSSLGFAPGEVFKGRHQNQTIYLEMTQDIDLLLNPVPKEDLHERTTAKA